MRSKRSDEAGPGSRAYLLGVVVMAPVPEGTTMVGVVVALPEAPEGWRVDPSMMPAPVLRVTPVEASVPGAGATGSARRTGMEPVLVPVGAVLGVSPRPGPPETPAAEPVLPEGGTTDWARAEAAKAGMRRRYEVLFISGIRREDLW